MQKKRAFFALLTVLGLALVAGGVNLQSDRAVEAARLNNFGVAYMNQQLMGKALEKFEAALAQEPSFLTARLNQAIALLNLQRFDEALPVLLEVLEAEPANLRARYNLGLLYKSRGDASKALEAFRAVQQSNPRDADSHYFTGLMHNQLGEYAEAIKAFNRALERNNFHVSAEFGLARAYQRSKNLPEARNHLKRFQYLTQNNLGAPVSLAYGEQGPYSLAENSPSAPIAPPPAINVLFTAATETAGIGFADSQEDPPPFGPGACFLDFDKDSRWDLLLINGNGASALYRNLGEGKFEDATKATQLKASGYGVSCAAADYDNDGWTDIAIGFMDRVALYHNQAGGTFSDAVPLQASKAGLPYSLTFVDYDHDGDADLYVNSKSIRKTSASSSALYRNNGNATFTDVSTSTGLTGDGSSFTAMASDFNNDRAVDFVLPGSQKPPTVFLNPREGKFRAHPLRPDTLPSRPLGAALLDFDQDGWMDIALTHWGQPGLTLWRNVKGESIEPVTLPDLGWSAGWGLAAVDYDNDGWLDLAAAGTTKEGAELRLLRNLGPEGFADVTKEVGLNKITLNSPRALITADYDQDGDTDLLLTQNGGAPLLLRNDGGNQNHSIRIALTGLADNRSAVGAKVEVFAGALRQKWEVQAASGFLGQSALEIVAGLGQAKAADIVRILWPTGVLQDEIEMAADRHAITETDRRGSSCPVLFAWNGAEYAMISDAIGPAVMGHWVGPGERNLPDPDEYIKVAASQIKMRDGRLSFRLAEPLEEVVYLDQVRLLAVDHPAGTEIYPNEYFAVLAPPPSFGVVMSRDARPPAGAWDDKGKDVLPDLLERDGRFVEGFAATQFTGYAQPHYLELDLGAWDATRPLRLLLHGFVDYFTATSLYAAYQADIYPISPYVEALDNQGRWVRVIDDIGFPAGLLRTTVADLSEKLPANTRRIRLVTNLQIYWDQVLIDSTPEERSLRLRVVPLARASLNHLGYPRYVDSGPRGNVTYLYNEVSSTGPYARFQGSYTRYGVVQPLLAEVDDRMAIFGPGEEVALDFDPSSLPPVPEGWIRDYLFFAHGFVKDMDFYAAHASTVGPLPFNSMGRYPYPPSQTFPSAEPFLDYLLDYLSRYDSGQTPPSYRYDFPEKK